MQSAENAHNSQHPGTEQREYSPRPFLHSTPLLSCCSFSICIPDTLKKSQKMVY